MSRPALIAFFPEASFGAALNCVGIARALRARGAEPVFLCHPGFTGVFAEYGFREYHLSPARLAGSGDYWQSFVDTHLSHFDQTPLEQLRSYVAPTWEAIVDTVIAVEDSLESLLAQIQPDLVLLDNVVMFPAILRAGVPWIRVVSCAETEISDPLIPPPLSGLSPGDQTGRAEFETEALAATKAAHDRYNGFRRQRGLRPLPPGMFLENSAWNNLLLAPTAVRYRRAEPLPQASFTFLEGCVRDEGAYDPPPLPDNRGPLVYMSFGSLGASDIPLIRRMIAVFAGIRARFFVNVGGYLDAYHDVPDNVLLGSWFPQPAVLSEAQLFIHHGGNNSFCEALFHGVPSLIMPYCWDGHDNARRADDTGCGVMMHRSDWTPSELAEVIEGLLDHAPMRAHLAAVSAAMKADPGVERAADAVLAAIGRGGNDRTDQA
ncbi:glycosyltransferase [Pseudogemmobacter bohemicus]|uniref:glycosyltransferase n=1 Tax=Pseudogemmobacter bohemicus TaxID=2250708 RepID=UPI000DD3C7DD|nr:glycosyltransferase [Pseudogemmobacter bohemicus]